MFGTVRRRAWYDGEGEYRFKEGRHELRIFWSAPTEAQAQAVCANPVHLGVLVDLPVIVFVWRVEGLGDWFDSPFCIRQVPQRRCGQPSSEHGREATMLYVTLIDSATDVVRATRLVTMPQRVAEKLHEATAGQADTSGSEAAFDCALISLYARFPDGSALAAAAGTRNPKCW